MNKFSKYFLSGFFLLVMLLSMWFVFADSYDVAPSTAEAGETVSLLTFNVSNTSSIGNNLTSVSVLLTGTASIGNLTNVTISDGTNTYYNDSITGTTITLDVSNAQITAETNFTINYTLDSSATWNVTLGASVTAITNQTNISYSAVPYTSSNVSVTETTAPTTSLSKSSSTRTTITVSFSCSDATSGISSCSLSSSSGTVSGSIISGLSCRTSYTITVTAEDNAGNTATSSESFSTSSSCGGGSPVPQLPQKTHSWTKITPGVVTIMKDFDAEIGIRQIQIDVNNPAQNVKITVTKHDGKPAEVSVEKTGKVHQYLQIGAENFDNTLDKATVEFRVGRTWAAGVELEKNDIAVFRYNETASRWDELTTTSTGEDATYYYYDVELDEFSYFAISEKSVVTEEESILGVEKSKLWLWILVAVAIIVIIVWQMKIKKK